MNRRWICNDVWMDIFPSFDRPQLGLKLALLSPRFNALVDKHFDGKSELTIWRRIEISKHIGTKPKLSVQMNDKFVEFPLPDRPLPSKIRFKFLRIDYIDHSVIAFLRANHQIFDKSGTKLRMGMLYSYIADDRQPIWDVFVREIWPIFASNIRHLDIIDADHLDNLRRRTSPTILTDLNQLSSIDSVQLLPDAIDDDFDGPNATAGQALSKWLHSPRKDGQPKRFRFNNIDEQVGLHLINNFKQEFMRATTISSVSYEIHFSVHVPSMPLMSFELVNERTQEKLMMTKGNEKDWENCWIMKRCKIIGETAAAVQQQKKDENWNNVLFWLFTGTNCIGPLSPPSVEDEAGQSITKEPSSADN